MLSSSTPLLLAAMILSTSTTQATPNDSSRALHALFEEQWEEAMRRAPTWASQLGDRRYNDRWEDLRVETLSANRDRDRKMLERLKAIDFGALPPEDRINYRLFEKEVATGVREAELEWYLLPVNQRGGIQTTDELTDTLRFESEKDYQDWIARLAGFRPLMDQTLALMKAGMARKYLLPRIVMERVPEQIDKQIVEDPEKSPYYKPFVEMEGDLPDEKKAALRQQAKKAISEVIVPAFREMKQFFEREYLPACLPEVGIWQLPDGGRLYSFFVEKFTTTAMTPEEVHQVGLSEVSRIRGEMEKIREKVGFAGTLKEFFQHLRTDPKYFHRSGDELLAAYRAMTRTIDPKLVKVFGIMPRMPYGVEPIPDKIAPDTTTAYYMQPAADGSRPGTYYVNLYKPETRPRWEMMALSLHEAVPGHHLQIALAMEQGEQPKFRRYGGYTAFVEGWGLYAESLGADMGLYDDPYDRFGQLTYEMWRAVRLVVDTGMHFKKWTRQQAIDFFMDNAAKTELDIVNEIDRYISWPGQALAYKIGELKLQELRRKSRETLGEKFEIRAFHDFLMKTGAVPLDVLEELVKEWWTAPR